jgi:hypothetical protein
MRFEPREVRPDAGSVLRCQGIPLAAVVTPRRKVLLGEAAAIFAHLAQPVALFDEVTKQEFDEVYAASRRNEPDTPLAHIIPRAGSVALFAATVGADVVTSVRDLFRERDAAMAFTLDAFASAAAESLADLAAAQYLGVFDELLGSNTGFRVLPYWCGYCGWHVSGQVALFERLRPQEIGIGLNARCLMVPEKSVSGVLVAGAAGTHVFRPAFPFCEPCVGRQCRERMLAARGR